MTIEVASFYSSPEQEKAFKGLILDFRKQNPGYAVKYKPIGRDELERTVGALLSGPGTPDVITWFSGNTLRELANGKLIEPFDTLIPKDSMSRNFSAGFQRAASVGDRLYMLPLTWSWWAVYYNKDIFTKNKLDVPQTWEDFVACCKTLKSNKITPIAFAGKDKEVIAAWFTLVDSIANGWELHGDLVSGKISYTDKRVRAVLQNLVEFTENGFFQANSYSYDLRDASFLMLNKQAGMCLASAPAMRAIIPTEQVNTIGYFRLPDQKSAHTYAILAQIEGFILPAKAFNKNGAAKFLNYMTKAEAQDLFLRPLKTAPANMNAPVPDAQTKWALTTSISASYAMQVYEKDVPKRIADSGLEAFKNIMIAPKDLDALLAGLEKVRIEVYPMSAGQSTK
jgi:multiple sugar transport system substrate-binding protein